MLPLEIENIKGQIQIEIENAGAELIDLTLRRTGGRSVLTVMADTPAGITLENCAQINRRVDRLLDELGIAVDALEVNSPGLDRPLKTEKDFLRKLGQTLRVTAREAGGAVSNMTGELASVNEGRIELRAQNGSVLKSFGLSDVVKAVMEVRFKKD